MKEYNMALTDNEWCNYSGVKSHFPEVDFEHRAMHSEWMDNMHIYPRDFILVHILHRFHSGAGNLKIGCV